MPNILRLAHLSDTHLGFTQYSARTLSGRPAREQDFVRAFKNVIDHINIYDPPLVIHSGDFYDKAYISLRMQKIGQHGLQELTRRPDGTTRAVVIISGNHDQPADPREPSALELNDPIPGLYVATSAVKVIDFSAAVAAGELDPALDNVVVTAVPHDQLRTLNQDVLRPLDGKVNVLVAHGVVGGSDLYKTTKGREFAISSDIIGRGWHYVALGHWHKRCPVAGGGKTTTTTPAYYAGSSENNGFSDVADNDCTTGRGYLQVHINTSRVHDPDPPTVTGIDLPVRAMSTLPPIDAAGKTISDIELLAAEHIASADITGAVIRQRIINISSDEWRLINTGKLNKLAQHALVYTVEPVYSTPDGGDSSAGIGDSSAGSASGAKSPREHLCELAAALYDNDPDRQAVIDMAVRMLETAAAVVDPATQARDDTGSATIDVSAHRDEHDQYVPSTPTP